MSNRPFNSCSATDGAGGAKDRQTGTVDSRSFPGHPGTSTSNSPLKAKRSLSDDRGKVASLSALPAVQGLDLDDGKPLLESAWMSIVGAAGKFLGRAQERHQWSDARMGMMNRLLCKNKSGTSQRAEDEETFRYYSSYHGVRNSDVPPSHKNSVNSIQSPADNDMLLTSISNRASPQVPGRAIDWGDGASALQQRDRDHRGKGSGEFSLPYLSAGQTSTSGLGQSADAILGLALEQDSIGRRITGDARRRHEDARQSGSGSNSTRLSVPIMPPIPRHQQQQQQQQQQLAAEPSEDHLHDLLNKLRARRLGAAVQHEPSLDAGASGSGSGPRRGTVHASHEFLGADVHRSDTQGMRRPPVASQAAGGRGPLGQRFSAHLASDLERQAKPSDAFHARHSSVIMPYVCDTVTTNRINSWLAKASPYQGEGPIDDNAAPEPAPSARKGLSFSIANDDSPRCSPEVDSCANDAAERDTQLQGSRRITHHGIDNLELRPMDARPWRSMNGTTKEAAQAPEPVDSQPSQVDGQGSASSRAAAAPRVQFASSRLAGMSFKLDKDNR